MGEKKQDKYILICLVTFTLSMLMFYWHFYKIETNVMKESSVTKYQVFRSRLKQSGELWDWWDLVVISKTARVFLNHYF